MSNIIVRDDNRLQDIYSRHEDSHYIYNKVKDSLIIKDNECQELAKQIYSIYMNIFENTTPSLSNIMSEISYYNEEIIFETLMELIGESNISLSNNEYEEYISHLISIHLDYISQAQSYEVQNFEELFVCDQLNKMDLAYLVDPSMDEISPNINSDELICNDPQNVLIKSFVNNSGVYAVSGELYLYDIFSGVV